MGVRGSFGVVALGAVLFGCGGSTSDGGAAPVARQDFGSEAADALCTLLAGCCQSVGFAYDGAACRSGFSTVAEADLSNPKITFDANVAGQCLAAVRSGTCNVTDGFESSCRGVFNGTVAGGGVCASSAECRRPEGGIALCESGICSPRPRGTAGDACSSTCTESGSSISCSSTVTAVGGSGGSPSAGPSGCYTNDGLTCGTTGTCVPLAQVSEPCTSLSCVKGAFCDFKTGLCAPVLTVGSDCSGSNDCEASAYCDLSTRKCATKKPDGASCQSSSECAGKACTSGRCASTTLATPASCTGVFK